MVCEASTGEVIISHCANIRAFISDLETNIEVWSGEVKKLDNLVLSSKFEKVLPHKVYYYAKS